MGEPQLVCGGLILRVEVRKVNLCGGQLSEGEVRLAVDAGIQAVCDDGDELLGAGEELSLRQILETGVARPNCA